MQGRDACALHRQRTLRRTKLPLYLLLRRGRVRERLQLPEQVVVLSVSVSSEGRGSPPRDPLAIRA